MAPRVLIVDDDRFNQSLLRDVLAAAGYEVDTASDGAEAVERVRASRPSLVLLDVMMPRVDGFAALRAIRAEASLAPTGVLVVSAVDAAESRLAALELGALDYLVKPLRPSEIRARVATALALLEARGGAPDPRVGDFSDLQRELGRELARADRSSAALGCLSVVPRAGTPPDPKAASRVARKLADLLRGSDRVYLLSAAELVALLPECGEAGLAPLLARVRGALEGEPFAAGAVVRAANEGALLLARAREAAGRG